MYIDNAAYLCLLHAPRKVDQRPASAQLRTQTAHCIRLLGKEYASDSHFFGVALTKHTGGDPAFSAIQAFALSSTDS
jgi:hypothetical protein